MPAPVTAEGNDLARGLDLLSDIIPATGENQHAITLSNAHEVLIEHISFSGTPEARTDAFTSVYLNNIDKATIRHCEFYGISSIGGGSIVRAERSDMSIELTVFLGCTGNSGVYGPVIENLDWRRFSISNAIFLDYGLRPFFGKLGLAAPISWINIGNPLRATPESPRREVIVRDVFLDEGGWVGISVLPMRFALLPNPIDLVYISGLKMNVSNLATTGHLFYHARNVLIENSHYGWSHNAYSAMHFVFVENIILDKLTCIAHAKRIMTDDFPDRLTVINSVYEDIDSGAEIITELETEPADDPVQYVRNQFVALLGREPDPAAHFYWSDLLIKCGTDNECLNQKRSALNEYLGNDPKENFSVAGAVKDENGNPIEGVNVSLTGAQSFVALTDSQGSFRFSGLPTSGIYTVAVDKRHYTFTTTSQTFAHPANDATVAFQARLNRHSIGGRLTRVNGQGMSGVVVRLANSTISTTTDANGFYSFPELAAGGNYTIVPTPSDVVFVPINTTFGDLSADRAANFVATLPPRLLTIEGSAFAAALDSVSFTAQPVSIFSSLSLSTDGFMRVMIFAINLEPVNSPSQISVQARDDEENTYPIEVEFISNVPGQTWLKQLNLKVSPSELGGKCVQLRLTVSEANSNEGGICIAGGAQ
jgi:hypothetical protein